MKEQRETENFMNTQFAQKGYTASSSYLSEALQDKLWEQNYRSGNLSKAGYDSQNDSCIPEKIQSVNGEGC